MAILKVKHTTEKYLLTYKTVNNKLEEGDFNTAWWEDDLLRDIGVWADISLFFLSIFDKGPT